MSLLSSSSHQKLTPCDCSPIIGRRRRKEEEEEKFRWKMRQNQKGFSRLRRNTVLSFLSKFDRFLPLQKPGVLRERWEIFKHHVFETALPVMLNLLDGSFILLHCSLHTTSSPYADLKRQI